VTRRKDGVVLTKEEIIVILDYFQHQYVHYDNILLIELLRRMEKELKVLENNEEPKEEDNESEGNREVSGARG